MAIIQGSGVMAHSAPHGEKDQLIEIRLIEQLRKEFEWALAKGSEVFNAFLIPPLQILAASVNFCTFLFTSIPIFEIPLTKMDQVMSSKGLLEDAFPQTKKKEQA